MANIINLFTNFFQVAAWTAMRHQFNGRFALRFMEYSFGRSMSGDIYFDEYMLAILYEVGDIPIEDLYAIIHSDFISLLNEQNLEY